MLELPELEQRLSNLQSQVERLWRKAESNVPPIEQRLAAMADQYAEYLKRWAATVERHTNAVAQLEAYASEWKDASTRVRQETADRLHELETTIEREWESLRRMQEEPIRELREQAESLTLVSQAMANASQQGVERAEARFSAFETEVHLRLNELTRELTTAVAEMKTRLDRLPGARDASSQWSLDDVTRLHGQLREGTRVNDQFPRTIEHSALEAKQTEPLTIGGRSVPDAGLHGRPPLKWVVAVAGMALILVLAAVFGWRMQQQIEDATQRAAIAEQKANVAITDAARQVDESNRQREQQVQDFRDLALRMQRISDVNAAPDLIRFNLYGSNGASGQVLFSRSRGIVVSVSRLPATVKPGVRQVWLLTQTTPVKVGTLVTEADGTATLVAATPDVPRRVVGAQVTEESTNAVQAPSGPQILTSVATAAPQSDAEAQP